MKNLTDLTLMDQLDELVAFEKLVPHILQFPSNSGPMGKRFDF